MWKDLEEKLNKSGRKWKLTPDWYWLSYRCAELFCEECGAFLEIRDIACTNLESTMYCNECVQKYINDTPITLPRGTIKEDFGTSVTLEYKDNYYESMTVKKTCYFNKKGRYIQGKRYYI